MYVWQSGEQWQKAGLGWETVSCSLSMLVWTIFCTSRREQELFSSRCQLSTQTFLNSLSHSPSSPLSCFCSRFTRNLRRNHAFYTWGESISPTTGTELIKFVILFFFFRNLQRQKRNRMEIYPAVRARIPTPTRPLTPTMIRRDWGLKGNCNATVLRSLMIKSTAWRRSLSGLIIQSKDCNGSWFT